MVQLFYTKKFRFVVKNDKARFLMRGRCAVKQSDSQLNENH